MGDGAQGRYDGSEIAVIGMDCRFPGARSVEQFWHNLRQGAESISRLSDRDLIEAGVPQEQLRDSRYVKASPLLDGVEDFDASFFGYNALEARLMDPQQRLFLECCWHALEHSGYSPSKTPQRIGVFAGSKTNTYLFHLASNRELLESMDMFQLVLGGDQAMLATRISYKFDLKGPSYSVQTACSSSLVAIHLACQSLLLDECQLALAGGVAVNVPHKAGYLYQQGGILSPDGHCRPFDARAGGTLFGSGAGVVVLKRLEDALADGDPVYAVILGSATNNDGALKANFTAPSVEGQVQVILEALACSGAEAESISYVETHGTGTQVGDPIEVLALTEAFRSSTSKKGFCAIGSVKSNLGHLDAAAGISSFLKTVLALERGWLPASLHYEKPNPRIDFESSPFFVNDRLTKWRRGDRPRRAGVSSFGFGGTNAHLILEEAPLPQPSGPSRPSQLLILSARQDAALQAASANLSAHLKENPNLNLADVAFTLQLGRTDFSQRRFLVCRSLEQAVEALESNDPAQLVEGSQKAQDRPVAFLFPGQGAQYVGMSAGLYESEPEFRRHIDTCAEFLKPHLGVDLREEMLGEGFRLQAPGSRSRNPDSGSEFPDLQPEAWSLKPEASLSQTSLTQPAVFVVEYALAQLLMSWGVQPAAMIGHSIGEYVAACLAGVFSLEEALGLVAARGRLMQRLPGGSMLSVSLSEEELNAELGEHLALAAVNAPRSCVASGPEEEIEKLEQRLKERKLKCRRLHTSHAFHSTMMEPALAPFRKEVEKISLQPPRIPYLSNLTGGWITAEQATDPAYWTQQLRQTVRFSQGLGELLQDPHRILLEVGPGTTLSSLARKHGSALGERAVLSTLRHPQDSRPDLDFLLHTLGRLWLAGASIDWNGFWHGEKRRRLPLPGYPFQRQRYWIDVAPSAAAADFAQNQVSLEKKSDLSQWFYRPLWRQTDPVEAAPQSDEEGSWLILGENQGLAATLAKQLRGQVVWASAGRSFERKEAGQFSVRPANREDLESLLKSLQENGQLPKQILHLWSLNPDSDALQSGFYSLLALSQALGSLKLPEPLRLTVLTCRAQPVSGEEELNAEQAACQGPLRVLPKEQPQVSCRSIDLDEAEPGDELASRIRAELLAWPEETACAYRQGKRWVEDFEQIELTQGNPALLKRKGVYWILGGLGGLGLVVAEHLARKAQARLVLTGRTALPERESWQSYLVSHPPEDRLSGKIRKLIELESLGAQVLALSADASDPALMQQALERTLQEFGRLDGLIHAAGIAGGGLMQLKTPQMAEAVLRPKIEAARILAMLVDGLEQAPDFVLLFSSLQTVLGDFGQGDYTSANAFLDAFAHQQRRLGRPFLAIDWDNWQEVGIAVETAVPDHLKAWREELLAKAIASSEGVEVLDRILARGLEWPRLVVSTQELDPRIELSRSFTGGRIVAELAGGRAERGAGKMPALPVGGSRRDLQRRITSVWKSVLEVEQIGLNDNFFDLGGNSLTGMQLISELNRELGADLSPVQLFEAPTPSAVLNLLATEGTDPAKGHESLAKGRESQLRQAEARQGGIAVIGLAGRFPGASNVEQLWENLCQGIESIRFFSDQELREAGVPAELLDHPDYVKARPVLEDAEMFDAAFFGISPREARITDPQQRVFLELCYQALEDSGQDPMGCSGPVGVFAGSSISSYLRNLYANPEFIRSVGDFQALIGNEKDSLPMRVSYKLNLRGPSLAVQTFCSTSLVAVHLACRSLLEGECEMALAGGASIHFPQTEGYLYDESGGVSRDGHLRAFDAQASGYIFGSGAAVVVLKPLEDALRDGDPIRAVIRGSSVTNDGALKAGYTATAVEGQSEAIALALARSGAAADSIGYLECHGSGTPLGDPVEIKALSRIYGKEPRSGGRCPIGSIKTNLGHLDRAAGAAGLIKAVLTLQKGKIPASLHFDQPNPNIDFDSSPFAVSTELRDFDSNGKARRAAVNSLGLGGTNAHVILEEAPQPQAVSGSRSWQLLCLSARSATALEAVTQQMANRLNDCPQEDLPEVAYTLQTGRHGWESRRILVCSDPADAVEALQSQDKRRVWTSVCRDESPPPVAFLLPGLGSQYPGMARQLYEAESAFRQEMDRCVELLQPLLGENLLEAIYPPDSSGGNPADSAFDLRRMLGKGSANPQAERLNQTRLAQPGIFAIEYSLASLWMSWGIRPQALIGYSVGEYVAACLAGILSLEDALQLVARRAQLIDPLPQGAMLSVPFDRERTESLLGDDLWLAAINGPQQSVLAGSPQAVQALQERLEQEGESCRLVQTTHAFHTPLLEPIRQEITRLASSLNPGQPRIPCISNLTGSWMSAEQAADPGYWAEHACSPVLFGQGIAEILKEPDTVLLEVGPGQTLGSLALQSATSDQPTPRVLASLRHSYENRPDQALLLETLGKLWLLGVQPDWKGFYAAERRRKLSLPTYPFERRRFWVDAAPDTQPSARPSQVADGQIRIFTPTWKRSVADAPQQSLQQHWLVFEDSSGLGEELCKRLEEEGGKVSRVRAGERSEEVASGSFTLDPAKADEYSALLSQLESLPESVVHMWGLEGGRSNGAGQEAVRLGAESVAALASALNESGAAKPLPVWVLTKGVYEVNGEEPLDPLRAAAVGICQSVPLRYPGLVCRCLDLSLPESGPLPEGLANRVLQEFRHPRPEQSAALRGVHRWTPALESLQTPKHADAPGNSAGSFLLCGMLQDAPLRLVGRALEEQGKEVRLVHTSLTDREGLRQAVDQARQTQGGLRGVVCSAAAAFASEDSRQVGSPLQELERSLSTLDQLVRQDALEFRLLVSFSASAGGMGLEAGFASNLFLESFAHASQRSGKGWTSLHWDVREDGEQARNAFRSVLSLCRRQAAARLLVSARPLDAQWNRLVGLEEDAREADDSAPLHPRPQLRVEYTAPESDTQKAIAAVWEQLLGIERVGLDDGFLELGGDSLLASRLVARLQDVLQLNLPVRLFFEASTVRELAQAVEEIRARQEDQELKELFEQLEGLSEEEVRRELAKRGH